MDFSALIARKQERFSELETAITSPDLFNDPKKANITPAQQPPDGQPIGMDWWGRADDDCNWQRN